MPRSSQNPWMPRSASHRLTPGWASTLAMILRSFGAALSAALVRAKEVNGSLPVPHTVHTSQ